jgi:menaquinone-dependent protoporphyrinogen oxidase
MDGERIVVTTAGGTGSIEEVGEEIAGRLRRVGLPVDTAPADQVRSLAPYRAAVLGSEAHEGHWRHDALAFLHRFRRELAERDLWLFQIGPVERDAEEPTSALPHRVEEWLGELRFRGHATFEERWMGPKHVRGSGTVSTGDEGPAQHARDHDRVRAFADGIAEALVATAP